MSNTKTQQKDIVMNKAHWEQGAVHYPGRMKRAAAAAGMSVHAYMEKHKHSPGSLGAAARLGLRFEAQAHHKKKKRKMNDREMGDAMRKYHMPYMH